MYDFDDDEIVVSGAGGSNYITVGVRTNQKTGVVMPLKRAQEARKAEKDKAKKKAGTGKKQAGTRDKRKSDAANRPVPKGKRKPMSRG